MSELYTELLAIMLAIEAGTVAMNAYVSPLGIEMVYVGKIADQELLEVEHINFQGHIFLLD